MDGSMETLQNDATSVHVETLEEKVKRLEAHVFQLQNLLNKDKKVPKKHEKKNRPFDFSKYPKRHILLKFLYLGWDRQGFAVQEDSANTIESIFFDALYRTKLVESRETSNYHRCGRTDKGVSAYSQVISITVRSNLKSGKGVVKPTNGHNANGEIDEDKEELNYPSILNRVLPEDIRVLAWCPIDEKFSARFDCTSRTYKYFFPKGNLNIQEMEKASKHLIGEHDYRNLCKMDVGNGVINYQRRVDNVEFTYVDSTQNEVYQMMCVTITGKAFLWHQIRAMMTVLLLVGDGKEDSSIIEQLLDVTKVPKKPQFGLASEIPLNLFSTDYNDVTWISDKQNIEIVNKQLQTIWTQHAVRSSMLKTMAEDLSKLSPTIDNKKFVQSLATDCNSKVHKPLLERLTGKGLDEQIKHYQKRRKITSDV